MFKIKITNTKTKRNEYYASDNLMEVRPLLRQSHLFFTRSESDVQRLVNKGIDINSVNKKGENVLHTVRDLALAKYFIEQGVDINQKDNDGFTPIYTNTNPDIVNHLIEIGADTSPIIISNINSMSPFVYQTIKWNANLEVVKVFLKHSLGCYD